VSWPRRCGTCPAGTPTGSARTRCDGSPALPPAGQFEKAVEQLIRSLHTRAEPVTADERDELRAVLEAMNIPGDRIDGLALQS
jgi:hypothetical protein